jgi:hypothetical protein
MKSQYLFIRAEKVSRSFKNAHSAAKIWTEGTVSVDSAK